MSSWVLDASAVIAVLDGEPGREQVRPKLRSGGATISAVNLSEVVTRHLEGGFSENQIRDRIQPLSLEVVPFDADLAYAAARLRAPTRSAGLGLGDRACLALAQRLGVPAVTADRAWATLGLPIEIELIR